MTSARPKYARNIGLFFAAAIALLGSLGAPVETYAQSCCAATGAGEFAVVGRCQSAVLAAQLSADRPVGTYSADGTYHRLENAEVDDFILSIGGGFRLFSPTLQVYGSVPMHLQYRSFGDESGEFGAGLGDVAGGIRWTAFEDTVEGIDWSKPRSLVPFVDLYVDVKTPTGRAPDDSDLATAADVTGGGFWQLSAGMKVSKFLLPSHALILNGSYAHPLAHEVKQSGAQSIDFARGQALNLQFSYLYIHNLFWSWGLSSSLRFEGNSTINGNEVADSSTRLLRFGGHVTHGFSYPFWEATLSVMMDSVWVNGGSNIPYVGPTALVSVRRQFL